ncbi:MAG: SLBB domain-containing protein [Bacteroidetes bacterium]|nr:SLBB domain-containing protein [Bacteroidota bacterium]
MRPTSAGRFPDARRILPLILLLSFLHPTSVMRAQDPGAIERKGKAEEEQEKEPPVMPVVEIPVSDSSYIIGPGDILAISIFGTEYYSFSVSVNSDGTIVIPKLGTVSVRSSTLRDVRDRIHTLLRQEVRRADIIISLARARQVKVTVAGAVRKPGIVILPATARVSEALAEAGGAVRDTTAMRNIRIRRTDGSEVGADLLRYMRIGDLEANPFVSGGDRIYFPPRDRLVGLFGAVGMEGLVDFVPGERLFDLIEACQGLRASAFRDSVEVVRFREDNVDTDRFFINLCGYPDDESVNILLHAGDHVFVRQRPQFQQHRLVLITGEVRHQGSYAIELGKTRLSELIRRAGGFTPEASLEEAVVIRKPPDTEKDAEFERLQKIPAADMREDEYEYFKARSREKVGMMVVNFKGLFLLGDSTQDIIMREGDLVEIPKEKNYIRIIGRVDNPGNVIYNEAWTYMEYINTVGGFGWRADDGDVRVVKARTGELVDASDEDDYQLEPGDTIWVPEVPKTQFWEVAFTALGVISQVAGIVGIIIAVSRVN